MQWQASRVRGSLCDNKKNIPIFLDREKGTWRINPKEQRGI